MLICSIVYLWLYWHEKDLVTQLLVPVALAMEVRFNLWVERLDTKFINQLSISFTLRWNWGKILLAFIADILDWKCYIYTHNSLYQSNVCFFLLSCYLCLSILLSWFIFIFILPPIILILFDMIWEEIIYIASHSFYLSLKRIRFVVFYLETCFCYKTIFKTRLWLTKPTQIPTDRLPNF